jgi:arylformamidase
MKIFDITLPISESMAVWPGDPMVRIRQPLRLDKGDIATVSQIELGSHTGTHVDAPAHFLRHGTTIDRIDLEFLIGEALVVETGDVDALSALHFERLDIPLGVERLLLKTKNSDHWSHKDNAFFTDFVALTEDGARWLVDRTIRLVGIDYLSAAPLEDPAPVHLILQGAGVVLVEGLNLSRVPQGRYQLICLPMKLVGCDGAPARAVLLAD